MVPANPNVLEREALDQILEFRRRELAAIVHPEAR
jgi:hypothetical protein